MSANTTALHTLAYAIGAHDGSPSGAALAKILTDIADRHRPQEDGNCSTCALGDPSWPCSDWLDALQIAADWVSAELGSEGSA